MGPVNPHGSSACQTARTARALAVRASLEGAAGQREEKAQQQPTALYRCHLLNVWQSTGKGHKAVPMLMANGLFSFPCGTPNQRLTPGARFTLHILKPWANAFGYGAIHAVIVLRQTRENSLTSMISI